VARWLLILILTAYVLLAVAYSLGTPPWEAPDEPSHYLYAEYFAVHGSLPPEAPPLRGNYWEDGYATSLYEWYQLPLYYVLVAPQITLVNMLRPGMIPQTFPPVAPGFPEDVANVFAAPLDGSPGSPFASPGLRLARFFSVALGLGSLLVVYRVALLASGGDQVVTLTATGFMAFIPQYTFISGYVTNDNLVILMSAICLLAFLSLLKPLNDRIMWRVAATGALLALALYTKLSLLFVLPLGLLCILLRFTRHRSVGQWLMESSVLVSTAIVPLVLGLMFLPAMREQVAYAYASLQPKPQFMSLQYLTSLWPLTYTSFWGRFGWMNVATPLWIADTMNAVTLVGLIGVLVLIVRGKSQIQAPTVRQSLVLLWATCALVALGFILFNLSARQPQGRLLFPALPALVVLVALGYRLLAGKLYPVVGASIVLLTFVANLVCLFGALLPAYALPI
jgi:4-amino-4-deoxy-L-arabinose transferase-like glycosyltransferase